MKTFITDYIRNYSTHDSLKFLEGKGRNLKFIEHLLCLMHFTCVFSFIFSNNLLKDILKMKVKVAQSCLTLCNPIDYIVHGILQARILEWVAVPFSRGSFQSRDQTQVSHIAGRFFTS